MLLMSIEHQGLMGEVDELFVLPEERSCGIGARLLAAAEAELSQRGCVRLQLQLASGNTRGRAFYERCGYASRAGYQLLDKALR
jgi:GNAT superfamily N-acetyltransferase